MPATPAPHLVTVLRTARQVDESWTQLIDNDGDEAAGAFDDHAVAVGKLRQALDGTRRMTMTGPSGAACTYRARCACRWRGASHLLYEDAAGEFDAHTCQEA